MLNALCASCEAKLGVACRMHKADVCFKGFLHKLMAIRAPYIILHYFRGYDKSY